MHVLFSYSMKCYDEADNALLLDVLEPLAHALRDVHRREAM